MDIKKFTGLRHPRPDDFVKLTMAYIDEVEAPFCRRGVASDRVAHRDSVTLCDETVKYLYTKYTPLKIKYKKGSRPELERIVDNLVKKKMTARQKALKILYWVRDISDLKPAYEGSVFWGGTEEEMIGRRTNYCGDLAHIMVVLCQIAGLPAREVIHYGTPGVDGTMLHGHGLAEVFVEGRWAYMDIRGKVFEWPSGRLASAIDLMRFPEFVDIQPRRIAKEVRPPSTIEGSRTFFTGRRVIKISNYFVWEHDKYCYTRFFPTAGQTKAGQKKQLAAARKTLRKMEQNGMYFPDKKSRWYGVFAATKRKALAGR